MKKPIAVVLGGTTPHIELIKNLQKRGYYTLLVDYLKSPPAQYFADEHIQESTLDLNLVLQIAKNRKASLVISTCIDQANITACYVSEKMGLPTPYSYETSLIVTDKTLMKERMKEHNISTSKYLFTKNFQEALNSDLSYPLVVKPSDSTGSKGVRRADTESDLQNYFKQAKEISRSGKVIVEEFNDGVELQVDCFIQNGKSHLIMIREKNRMNLYGEFVMQSFGSTVPASISEKIKSEILEASNKISKAFCLDNVPMFIQLIVDKDDKINILEFAPRVGGGLSYRMIKKYTGFDFLNGAVNSCLGLPTKIEKKSNVGFLQTGLIYASEGIFGKITGFENLMKDELLDEHFLFFKEGATVSNDLSTKSRVGAFLITADTSEELKKKFFKTIEYIDVKDINGISIMRKDIYSDILS